MRPGVTIALTAVDRRRLGAIVGNRNVPQKHAWRAEIVLLTADGLGTVEIMRPGARGAQAREHAHPLLGLDLPRRRSALPKILRHSPGAPAVRIARRARHDLRRGAGECVRAPSPACRGDAPRRVHLVGGAGDRLQLLRAGGAFRYVTTVSMRNGAG